MARKDDLLSDSPPLQKYRVYSPVGGFVAGQEITSADLYPSITDQVAIDDLLRRLLSLNLVAPIAEFSTPAAPAPTPEVIQPVRLTNADHIESVASTDEHAATVASVPTFKVPTFAPPKGTSAK